MAALITPDEIDFAAYLKETEALQKVRPAKEFIDDMLVRMYTPSRDNSARLPWPKVEDKFRFRPGEVTLWAGINGHGKSLVTGQTALSLMGQGQTACIASFEMKPYKTLERMSRQWSGQSPALISDHPDIIEGYSDIVRQFGGWTDGKLWLYDQQGTVDAETVVSVVRYCAKEMKIQHIFVDSLMKCVKNDDDYNGQKYIVDEFCAIARDHETHIHLVHHIKKLKDEEEVPGKFDAKGSSAITDQVDNMLIQWRNIRKDNDRAVNKPVSDEEPDALLICIKQRNGEWTGRMNLWFDNQTQQFMGAAHDLPVSFDRWPHAPWGYQ